MQGHITCMKKYELREVAARRSAFVFLLVYVSFGLGAYSEKEVFTAWGWVVIIMGIIIVPTVLFLLMRDFWSTDD